MNSRRDVNIYADIKILELCVNQRINADTADARLERTGRNGDALADL